MSEFAVSCLGYTTERTKNQAEIMAIRLFAQGVGGRADEYQRHNDDADYQ